MSSSSLGRAPDPLTADDISSTLDKAFVLPSERPRFLWPGDKPLAVIFEVAIEYFKAVQPRLYSGAPSLIPAPVPAGVFDFFNWAWRNYGLRVGVWRLLDAFAAHNVPVSASTNAIIHEVFPQMTQALRDRGCELLCAHGYIQDKSLLEFADDLDAHREYVVHSLRAHERATGVRPKGWISPAGGTLPETFRVLVDEGIEWTGFPCDDQPFMFSIDGHELVGLPHGINLTDYNTLIRGSQAFSQWQEAVLEQIDVLAEEAAVTGSGRVAMIGVHPHVMGESFRIRHFADMLAQLQKRNDLWWATQTEVATYYRQMVSPNTR